MTIEDQNFTMYAGDTKNLYISISDEDNGGQMDLTGTTIVWVLYDPNLDTILLTKTTASGISIPAPETDGICIVSLLPVDTELLRPANWYIHETEVTDAIGNVVTVTKGFVNIKRSRA
jgi:hypothetical protein